MRRQFCRRLYSTIFFHTLLVDQIHYALKLLTQYVHFQQRNITPLTYFHYELLRQIYCLGTVWLVVMLSMVVWGIALWLVQWKWAHITGGPDLQLDTVLLYAWGALCEVHPKVPTYATPGQASRM